MGIWAISECFHSFLILPKPSCLVCFFYLIETWRNCVAFFYVIVLKQKHRHAMHARVLCEFKAPGGSSTQWTLPKVNLTNMFGNDEQQKENNKEFVLP